MSRRNDVTLIRDMIDAADTAITSVKGKDPAALIADPVNTLGLVKCLEVVGEAAARLSSEFLERHHTIHWIQIVGMRHPRSCLLRY